MLSSHLSEVAVLHLLPQSGEETIDEVAHVLRLEVRVRVEVFDEDVFDFQLFLVDLVVKSINDRAEHGCFIRDDTHLTCVAAGKDRCDLDLKALL